MLITLILDLGDTKLAEVMRESTFAYPLVSSLHIIGIGLLVGSIMTLDLRLLGVIQRGTLSELAPLLSRISAIGLAVAVIAGVMLFSAQPDHYLDNAAFLIKVTLISLALFNVFIVHRLSAWRAVLAGEGASPVIKTTALLSLIFWLAAIFAGRWIAFV